MSDAHQKHSDRLIESQRLQNSYSYIYCAVTYLIVEPHLHGTRSTVQANNPTNNSSQLKPQTTTTMGQDHDNPTVRSAEEATGMEPLNKQPSQPQIPQSGSMVKNPTLDTLPESLSNLPSPSKLSSSASTQETAARRTPRASIPRHTPTTASSKTL